MYIICDGCNFGFRVGVIPPQTPADRDGGVWMDTLGNNWPESNQSVARSDKIERVAAVTVCYDMHGTMYELPP